MGFEKINVSVAIIVREGRILAVYNPAWGAFSLPMSKRRVVIDNQKQAAPVIESSEHAAARACAEVVGRSIRGLMRLPSQPPGLTQSDRTGEVKDYQTTAFRYDLQPGIEPRSDLITEWLTLDEWLDPERHPISPTAIHILKFASAEAALAGRHLV